MPLLLVLAGTISICHPRTSFLSVVKSLAPLAAVLDFVYRAEIAHGGSSTSFSRMGYVNATHAYVAARSALPGPVQISYRSCRSIHSVQEAAPWLVGPTHHALPTADQVVTFTLSGLVQNTCYEYVTNAGHSGSFRTPAQDAKRFFFLATSCILPFFPYAPTDHSLRIRGLEALDTYLQRHSPDFMLFLGDFIYADLPKRLGFSTEHYRRLYRKVYSSPSWSRRLRSLPWLHAYDDHEITNDWAGGTGGIYRDAIHPYVSYQHAPNGHAQDPETLYYTFDHGDVSFFVLDTRCCRSPGDQVDGSEKTMLGTKQLADLRHWLKTASRWKFVVSSVPFTVNFGAASMDSWAGYRFERQLLLQEMWRTNGVVIISGDRHEHATTMFKPPEGNKTTVIEFSTSPLNQFNQPPSQRRYSQVTSTDQPIHYQPVGHSMFGTFSVDTSESGHLTLEFALIVDGHADWSYVLRL
ncbi:hypothetical protein VTK73DRAFT_7886 [Phialemonium thermophilum]|uniref:PhoD-like phosphatase metallophosphatase domain-containing protein n=1 Tax=Phialemonium thermophilum TaxID=223376 RepID=A0ABR3XRC8_9PEZI